MDDELKLFERSNDYVRTCLRIMGQAANEDLVRVTARRIATDMQRVLRTVKS